MRPVEPEKVTREPYTVETSENGCQYCGSGRMYSIMCPDGSELGRAWSDEDEAVDMCGMLNMAHAEGRRSASASIVVAEVQTDTQEVDNG